MRAQSGERTKIFVSTCIVRLTKFIYVLPLELRVKTIKFFAVSKSRSYHFFCEEIQNQKMKMTKIQKRITELDKIIKRMNEGDIYA